MSRAPTSALRRTIATTKCAIVAALTFTVVSTASSPTLSSPTTAQNISAPTAGRARLDKLVTRHGCSATGFGDETIPGSSLVLEDNKVRHVSFDDGWAVYTGEQSGTLIAVCRSAI